MKSNRPKVDHSGEQIGDLKILKRIGDRYLCNCYCGTEKTYSMSTIHNGKIMSCGCWKTNKWTDKKDKTLLEMASNGYTWWEIALQIHILPKRCYQRYSKLNGKPVKSGESRKMCIECKHYDVLDIVKNREGMKMALCRKHKKRVHRCDWACNEFVKSKNIAVLEQEG